jgi:hypothetical protein
MDTAALKLFGEINPYLVAAAQYETDLDSALESAHRITLLLPESDENVAAAYTLKGAIFLEKNQYPEAEAASRKASSSTNTRRPPARRLVKCCEPRKAPKTRLRLN